jgi:hypothetical protein
VVVSYVALALETSENKNTIFWNFVKSYLDNILKYLPRCASHDHDDTCVTETLIMHIELESTL